MLPAEVFLSYSSHDREMAERLGAVLRAHKIPVWFGPANIIGAQQWHDEIGVALERCDWFMVLLSPDALSSKWVKRELLFALQNDQYDNRIIPVLYRSCDYRRLSWTLSSIQMIDLSGEFAAGCRDMLRIWGIQLRHDLQFGPGGQS